jgi:osmotically-inducible protein OsmY
MLKTIKLVILAILSLTVIACGGTSTQESTGQYLDSSATTAKVKANLVDSLGSKGFAIQVKTYKDQVQLSGFVDSTTTKKRAGTIAASTMDVKRVRNDLIVKGAR